MKIQVVSPVPKDSRQGNGVTARRWAALLKELGHQVRITRRFDGSAVDVLVALHARKSHDSAARFKALYPDGLLLVALTGTDLYVDLKRSRKARASLRLADRLIVLQPLALKELPARERPKASVLYQSSQAPTVKRKRRPHGRFEVCVLGHLRAVKDPFRTALAARQLPAASKVHVTQVGRALTASLASRARAEQHRNARYQWTGELSGAKALRRLASSDVLVLSSRSEGGANVISEAVTCGVPILASKIPGSVGLLGPSYPGYFPFGDTRQLAALLSRAESEPAFLRALAQSGRRLRKLFLPATERTAWAQLLKSARTPKASRPKSAKD